MQISTASFWLRLLAFLNDSFIIMMLHVLFLSFILSRQTLSDATSVFVLYIVALPLNPLLYFQSAILTYYFGGSLGKLLTGLAVTNEDGKPLSLKRIFFRQTLGYRFSTMVFGLGYFSVLTDPKRQAWHDKTIGSLVVVYRPMWIVGMISLIAFVILNGYMIAGAVRMATTSPLKDEAMGLFAEYQSSMEQDAREKRVPLEESVPEELN